MAYNVQTKPIKEKKESFTVKNKKEREKKLFLENIKNKDTISEQEISLIKERLNSGVYTAENVNEIDNKRLTSEQNEKGYKYMYGLYKSPTGKERINNPYGEREQEVLNNYSHFELVSWSDEGNQFYKSYTPIYLVVAKDGSSFEYIMTGGKIKIIG